MAQVDLTEAEAALDEEKGEPHTIRFRGRDWSIPASMPPLFAMQWVNGDYLDAFIALLGLDQFREFAGLQPTDAQLSLFRDAVFSVYGGGDPGKSSAPDERSPSTSKRQKRTSKGTTRSS